MSEQKYLGKIKSAEYGTVKDYPFMMGIQLQFSFDGGGVGDGGKFTVNQSPNYKWESEEKKFSIILNQQQELFKTLSDAKVNYVSELKNKPIEIVIKDNMFDSFRILTEVL